jgi:hypothetical protein
MSPPRPASLDEVGEPWKDGADGDLGGTFRPAAAAAEGGSGWRSGLSGAPAKEQHQARGPCAASAAMYVLRRDAGAREIWSRAAGGGPPR